MSLFQIQNTKSYTYGLDIRSSAGYCWQALLLNKLRQACDSHANVMRNE